MRRILMVVSWCALTLIIVSPMLFFFDTMTSEIMKHLLLAGTCLWFGVRIPLSWREKE
jgi:hypothetical protein